MSVNVELLQQVMQHIDDHPGQHDQATWIDPCGTPACFAGTSLLLSDMRPVPGNFFRVFVDRDGEVFSVPEAAQRVLGLSDVECDILFAPRNTRPMLELMVKDLVNGDVLRDTDIYRVEAS